MPSRRPRIMAPTPPPEDPTRFTTLDQQIHCYIKALGKPLHIYDKDTMGRSKSGWIASTEGAAYTVVVECPTQPRDEDFVEFAAEVTIDGQFTASKITTLKEKDTILRIEGTFDGEVLRPFIFAKPILTDAAPPPKSPLQVGTITVRLRRAISRAAAEEDEEDEDEGREEEGEVRGVEVLNEGDKKGIVCAVTALGPEKDSDITLVNIRTHPDDKRLPLFTFTFKYLPVVSLRVYGIAPAAEEDVIDILDSSDSDSDIEITREQINDHARLARRMSEVKARQNRERLKGKSNSNSRARALAMLRGPGAVRVGKREVERQWRFEKRLREVEAERGGWVDLTSG